MLAPGYHISRLEPLAFDPRGPGQVVAQTDAVLRTVSGFRVSESSRGVCGGVQSSVKPTSYQLQAQATSDSSDL